MAMARWRMACLMAAERLGRKPGVPRRVGMRLSRRAR